MSSNDQKEEKLPCNLKRLLKQVNIEAPNIEVKLRERASTQMQTYLQLINIRMHESDMIMAQRRELDNNLSVLQTMTHYN